MLESEDKRVPTNAELLAAVVRLDEKLDNHIDREERELAKFSELLTTFQQAKGMLLFVRILLFVGAPAFAAIYWIKDHVRL